jgi:hypothetical protein
MILYYCVFALWCGVQALQPAGMTAARAQQRRHNVTMVGYTLTTEDFNFSCTIVL